MFESFPQRFTCLLFSSYLCHSRMQSDKLCGLKRKNKYLEKSRRVTLKLSWKHSFLEFWYYLSSTNTGTLATEWVLMGMAASPFYLRPFLTVISSAWTWNVAPCQVTTLDCHKWCRRAKNGIHLEKCWNIVKQEVSKNLPKSHLFQPVMAVYSSRTQACLERLLCQLLCMALHFLKDVIVT